MSADIRTTFLPHVNGARALAIIGVILYHLDSSICPTGYFGVDLFLVISGYFLLSRLLKIETVNRFSYLQFLIKKAWRILPSWAVLSLVVCCAALLLMLNTECVACAKTVRYSSLFIVDYYLDYCYNYFNPNAHVNPLLHLWYLNLMGQLYLVAPLLLIYIYRLCGRRIALVALYSLGSVSLVFYILSTAPFVNSELQKKILELILAKSVYYHLIPRFWEVVAGYFIIEMPDLSLHVRWKQLLGFMGLCGIVASYFIFPRASAAPYGTVVCAMLILKYGDVSVCRHILTWRPLQFVGTISFSLYLWHWPVMVIWKYFCFTPLGVIDYFGMVLLSFVLGYLSWRWIESLKMPTTTTILPVSVRWGLPLVLPLMCLMSFVYVHYVERSYKAEVLPFANIEEREQYRDEALMMGFDSSIFANKPVYVGDDASIEPSFIIVGDSHSLQLYNCANQYCTARKFRGIHMNNIMMPVLGVNDGCMKDDPEWSEQRVDAFLSYLQAHPNVKYVLMAIWWEFRVLTNPKARNPLSDEVRQEFYEGLRFFSKRLADMGKQLIICSDSPCTSNPGPRVEWLRLQRVCPGKDIPERKILLSSHIEQQKWVPGLLQQLKDEGYIRGIVDMARPLLCGDYYVTQVEGEFVFWDNNHLSSPGQNFVVPKLMDDFFRLIQQDASHDCHEALLEP